jgi:uncharacterized protein (TIGR02646 family)
MIFIDPEKVAQSIPDDVKQQLQDATDDLLRLPESQRKAFIKRKENLWKDLRPYLAAVCGRDQRQDDFKCWYCEAKTSRFTYHVDHFRPKGRVKDRDRPEEPGYWWLAFDYRNYRLSCEYCNTPHRDDDETPACGKWDQFPLRDGSSRVQDPNLNVNDEVRLLIDPLKHSEVIFLSFEDTGRPRHLLPEGTYGGLMAARTIEVLNLDQPRINEARKQLALTCQRLVEDGNEEYASFSRTGSVAAREKFDGICQQLRDLIQPWSEFSAMARACLRGTGQEWVLDLVT